MNTDDYIKLLEKHLDEVSRIHDRDIAELKQQRKEDLAWGQQVIADYDSFRKEVTGQQNASKGQWKLIGAAVAVLTFAIGFFNSPIGQRLLGNGH